MTTEFDTRLRAADPAVDLPEYDPERARALLHRIVTEPPAGPAFPAAARTAPPKPSARRTRRLVLGGVGVLTAAAVTTGVLLVAPLTTPGPDGSTPAGASAAAAEVLRRAADITPVDPPTKPGQYWKITTTGTTLTTTVSDGTSTNDLMRGTRVEYVAVDGARPTWFVDEPSTWVRRLSGPPNPPPEPTRGTRDVWTLGIPPSAVPGSWQQPNLAWLKDVPREPAALRARLYADAAGHGQSTDGEVLVLVADVLRSGLVPGDLRAAMYRVLQTVPGVEVTGHAAVVNGRKGVAIGRNETAGVDRQEIVIDPANGQVIGERSVAITGFDGIPSGTVIGDTAVTRAVVDAVPADVVRGARHEKCEVSSDGAVTCRS